MEVSNGEAKLTPVSGLQAARTGTGGDGHDRPQGTAEHHDHVVAHDDGFRAAARGPHYGRAELFLRQPQSDPGMCHQRPDGRAGEKGRAGGEYDRQQGGQVQDHRPHARSRRARQTAADQGVLREF